MQHHSITSIWLTWKHFIIIRSSIGTTSYEYLYKQHSSSEHLCTPARIFQENGVNVYGAPIPVQSESRVFHALLHTFFSDRFFRDVVRVVSIEHLFFLTSTFLNQKKSTYCYFNDCSSFVVRKMMFFEVQKHISGDGLSVLYFTAKCLLRCCYLGCCCRRFRQAQNISTRAMIVAVGNRTVNFNEDQCMMNTNLE